MARLMDFHCQQCSLNTLGGKPLVSGSTSTHFVLICSILSRMILYFLLCVRNRMLVSLRGGGGELGILKT
jgi:hypothetical protein